MKYHWVIVVLFMLTNVASSGDPLRERYNEAEGNHTNLNPDHAMSDTEPIYAIAIHGGAGVISEDLPENIKNEYLESLSDALRAGEEILKDGGSSLDAVEASVRLMEDNPLFNAGKGAVYTSDGEHELDASIMDGSNLAIGAVAGVKTIKNPIVLARKVMEESNHVLFATEGAESFADGTDVERVDPSYFDTERRYQQLERAREQGAVYLDHSNESFTEGNRDFDEDKRGTVGAVALDQHGNLAAATSTGGMTNKQRGRIGDSPIVGAGTYADNNTAAISATGVGEEFIRHVVAYQITALMEYKGVTLDEAARHVIFNKLQPGDGGVIAVGKDGSISMPFSSTGMFRGSANSKGMFDVRIWK
ncbi:MAG: isoaspartyl peptidase/L-asparaginase [Balneolales bacterium]